MRDALGGDERVAHHAAEQIVLVRDRQVSRFRGEQRVVRHEIQSARIVFARIIDARIAIVLDCSERSRDRRERAPFVPVGRARLALPIGDDEAATSWNLRGFELRVHHPVCVFHCAPIQSTPPMPSRGRMIHA